MSNALRVLLVAISILFTWFMLKKIRNSKLQIEYAIFWILFAILLIVLAIFPGITYFGAELIGFISPANMIYLFVIFILMVKVFLMTIELSQLENKVNELIQKIALDEKEEENEKQS